MKIVEKHKGKEWGNKKQEDPTNKEPYVKDSKVRRISPKAGEVWTSLWNSSSEEAQGTSNRKPRPVYIYEVNGYNALCVEITGQDPRNNYVGEYVIKDWKDWGLNKPSVLRCSQIITLPISVLGEPKEGSKLPRAVPEEENKKIRRLIDNTYFNAKINLVKNRVNSSLEEGNKFRRMNRTLFGGRDGKIKTFAIISTENPLGWKNSDEQEFKGKYLAWTKDKSKYNKEQILNAKEDFLIKQITRTGDDTLKYGAFSYVPIKGSYGDKEKSFFIFNIPFEDAKEIARNYGQESFFFGMVKDGEMQVAYYETDDACKTYHRKEISNTITNEKDAEDFFSKYGVKYRINLNYFGDDVVPLDNEWGFEEELKEPSTFRSRARARRKIKESVDTALKNE